MASNFCALPGSDDYLAPRRCLRDPIAEIFLAADLLDRAVEAHLTGEHASAAELIQAADLQPVREWIESLWGTERAHPELVHFRRFRTVPGAPPLLPKADRIGVRMPTRTEKSEVIRRWGHRCSFCGIPVIRAEVRQALCREYPAEARWGATNETQHAALQCLWLQFDHVLPHSRGGDNSLDNVVITCAGCNYGRMHWTLEELGLFDPRSLTIVRSSWDGLERMLPTAQREVTRSSGVAPPEVPLAEYLRRHIAQRPIEEDSAERWPWLMAVRVGNFAAIPPDICWVESAGLAHLIDGYELAGGVAELQLLANKKLEKARQAGGLWVGTAVELWECLFAEHRRAHFAGEPSAIELGLYDQLCQSLRWSLLN